MDIRIENFTPADMKAVHALNESAVPEVSGLAAEQMSILGEQACYLKVARAGDEIAGFLLALQPGQDYKSENYRWFCEHYDDFVYIDRIVVADRFRGQGVGKALYEDIENFVAGNAKALACEVNLFPPNPGSLAFHHKYGFEEVGQQNTEGGNKRVSMLMMCLSAVSCKKAG